MSSRYLNINVRYQGIHNRAYDRSLCWIDTSIDSRNRGLIFGMGVRSTPGLESLIAVLVHSSSQHGTTGKICGYSATQL